MSPLRRRITIVRAAVLLSLLTCVASRTAAAQSKAECVASYKDGQLHRKNGELLSARASFSVCAATACPAVLRRDCDPWLQQVTAQIPSLIVSASAADHRPLPSPRVLLDSQPVTPSSDGSIEADPGAHLLRVEADGYQAVEQAVKLRAGDRGAKTLLVLAPIMKDDPTLPAHPTLPVAAIAFTAVGLVGIGSFATFGLLGDAAKSKLDECKPACAPSRVDEVKRDYVIADVSLGVGAIFLGLATYSFLTRSEPQPASRSFIAPTRRDPFKLTPTDLAVQVGPSCATVTISASF